jgi:hypothetical protein
VTWTFIWLMFLLKIPIFGLLWIVWWAIHHTDVEPAGDGGGGSKVNGPHGPRPLPSRPRPRGPHAATRPPSPPRVRHVVGQSAVIACPVRAAKEGAS